MGESRRRIELDADEIGGQVEHLRNGGVVLAAARDVAVGTELELELVGPGGAALVLPATAVYQSDEGTAFAFREPASASAAAEEWMKRCVADEDADADAGSGADAAGRKRRPTSPVERLRGLTMVQQLKVAREGEATDRVVLERLYGKAVWEALLRNPRINLPEVAHLARNGTLPRPLVELIVANAAWLQSPQVRRALLGNPRLGLDQIDRVLRATPRAELRLVPQQTAYPHAVRAAAKKMLHAGG